MAWTLHLQPIRNTRSDDALLTLGRALYISNAFEEKCRGLLRLVNLHEAIEGDPVMGLANALAQAPKDMMLGPTLKRLGELQPLVREQDEVLVGAREARNFIAHEGGLFDIHIDSIKYMSERLELLRSEVRKLTAGDNIMSAWIFQITEWKESTPRLLIEAYEDAVDRWVFDPVWNLLSHSAGDQESVPRDGQVRDPEF